MSGDSLWVERIYCVGILLSLTELSSPSPGCEEYLHCEESNSLYFNATIIMFVLPSTASSTPSQVLDGGDGTATSEPSTSTPSGAHL